MHTPPHILFEDDTLLAVNKPSGLLVHRGWGQDRITLVGLIKRYLNVPKVHPIHRLDRPTSGVLLFAKDPDTARTLGDDLTHGRTIKHYIAVVRGESPPHGLIDREVPSTPGEPERVPAQTLYHTLATLHTTPRWTSLVLARPLTGRAHQIRRHLKHINHPLIGDSKYGRGSLNRAFRDEQDLHRLCLHALSLTITHPHTQTPLTITAPTLPTTQHTQTNTPPDHIHLPPSLLNLPPLLTPDTDAYTPLPTLSPEDATTTLRTFTLSGPPANIQPVT